MELTNEDKQRIEQEVEKYTKDWPRNKLPANKVAFRNGYMAATLYERQQQAALKELNRTLYESNERQAVVISEFKQEGSSERARANNAVGKYWETLEANKKLEAERSELRNKVIDELVEYFESQNGLWSTTQINNRLESFKTK